MHFTHIIKTSTYIVEKSALCNLHTSERRWNSKFMKVMRVSQSPLQIRIALHSHLSSSSSKHQSARIQNPKCKLNCMDTAGDTRYTLRVIWQRYTIVMQVQDNIWHTYLYKTSPQTFTISYPITYLPFRFLQKNMKHPNKHLHPNTNKKKHKNKQKNNRKNNFTKKKKHKI